MQYHEATVMIVEDSPLVARIITNLMTRASHRVLEVVDSGSEAVVAWQNLRPTLTILDLHIPEKNGLIVLGEIMAIDASAQIIIVSGDPQAQIEQQCLSLGALGFLKKKNLKNLPHMIQTLVSKPIEFDP